MCLIVLVTPLLPAEPPTDEQIEAVFAENPTLIFGMVRKLYTLEHAVPVLGIPDLQVVEAEGEYVVSYQGPLTIQIGVAPDDELSYEVQLKVSSVKIGERPKEKPSPIPYFLVGGGTLVLGLTVGLIVGLMAH